MSFPLKIDFFKKIVGGGIVKFNESRARVTTSFNLSLLYNNAI